MMNTNKLESKIYIGTWCHEEESSIKAFFGWYFNQSLKNRSNFPTELTNDEWFEQFTKFHKEIWQKIKLEGKI